MHLARYTGASRACAYHGAMAQVGSDGTADANLQRILLEQQIEAMERPPNGKQPVWPWVLVIAGAVAMVAFGVYGSTAYATIARIDGPSNIVTANPVMMFQDVATNGPRVGSTVESSSRASYTRALEQFVLDGTGLILGFVLAVGGLFVRANL